MDPVATAAVQFSRRGAFPHRRIKACGASGRQRMNAHALIAAHTTTAVFLAATMAFAVPAAAQGKDELWEMSSKIEMAGMPMAMPAQVHRVCLGRNHKDEELVPTQGDCRVVDSKRAGNKFTYRMECAGSEPATVVGEMTFGTNAYDGRMKMTMTKTNDTMDMAVSGKRVGDCTAPAAK
jgi:hypothetical protein